MSIGQIFEIEDEPKNLVVQKPKQKIKHELILEKFSDDLLEDYTLSRENLDNLMEKGNDTLEFVLDLAKQSQNPRYFEIVTELIKNLSVANAGRMDIHNKTIHAIKQKSEIGIDKPPSPVIIDKAVFFGTSSDLLKQVKPRI